MSNGKYLMMGMALGVIVGLIVGVALGNWWSDIHREDVVPSEVGRYSMTIHRGMVYEGEESLIGRKGDRVLLLDTTTGQVKAFSLEGVYIASIDFDTSSR